MKKKILFSIIASFVLSTTILCISLFGNNQKVDALEVPINTIQTEINNQYIVGEQITIPETINVDYNGPKQANILYIEYPNGMSIKTNNVKFDETGKYKIKYNLIENDISVTFVQEVTVAEDYFTLSTDNGSYIKKSSNDDRLKSSKQGIIASLAEGATLNYNKTINLNDCGDDGLSNVIEIDPILGHFEDNKYVADQSKIYVVLTDCYDSKITVTLKIGKSENYNGALYPGVKTYLQTCKGLDKGDLPNLGNTSQIILDGEKYRLWPDEEGSMNVGLYNASSSLTTGSVWKYEPSTKRFYLSYNNGINHLVTDLDEPLIYKDEPLFPGFTTGEVKVSIYALSYYSPTSARIEINSIGNDKVYDLFDNKYLDDTKPEIILDYNKDSFYAALGETVTIPKSKVVDINYVKDANINVYTGYHSNNRTNVSIKNNTFVVNKFDLYTIEYQAIDKAGNETIKTIDVIVKQTNNNQTIELSYDEVSLECGKTVNLDYQIISSLNSSVEDIDVKINIKSERENLVLESGVEFTPLYDDVYEIEYVYKDDIFTYHTKYSTKCEKSNDKYFVDTWALPKHYIKSFKYSLNHLYAYSFENGYPETKEPNYYVVFDGGQEKLINDINNVQITGNNTAKFIARLDEAEYISDTFDIVDVSYNNDASKIDMTKLFFGDFEARCTNDKNNRIADVVFVSNKNSGSNTLSFINSVLVDMFKMTYKITEQNANFDSFSIKLTDFIDDSIYSTITIYNKEDGAYLSINDGILNKLADFNFYSNSKNTIMYNYYSTNLYVGSSIFKTKFNFPSSRCYIDVTLNGIHGNSAIQIAQINNQVISGNNYNDNAGPEILYEDFQGHYALNDVVNISKFIAGDVLKGCNYNSISYYVVAPNNSNAYDANGNILDELDPNKEYTLKLTELGNYYVIYKIEDFNNRISTAQVCVTCVDTISPTIKLDNMNDNATIIVKAGQEIEIDFTIKDDVSICKAMKAFIHLYCIDQYSYVPNISKIDYKNMPEDGVFKERFIINVKGRYEAQIHVYDEMGNEAIKRINIVVE